MFSNIIDEFYSIKKENLYDVLHIYNAVFQIYD